MLGNVALLAALSFAPLYAIEACAIVHAAELIVVGKLNNAKYSASPKPARITGRLHIAGLVTGTRPDSTQVDYDFDCSDCRELKPRDVTFLSKEYGIWFLRKNGDVWTSAGPQSADPRLPAIGHAGTLQELPARSPIQRRAAEPIDHAG